MTILTEQAAEDFVAARALAPGRPGFVGVAVDLLLDPESAPSARRPLRHGFLDARSPRVAVVSGPPSPGIEIALRRMSDDLAAATRVTDQQGLTVLPFATDTVHPDSPAHAYGTATAGLRVGLEAGLDEDGPLGLRRRWVLAHTLAPVLAAAFANAPLTHGRPSGWRSVRQALRRDLPVLPGHAVAALPAPRVPGHVTEGFGARFAIDPRTSWAAAALDAPTVTGRSLRDRLRAGARLTESDLLRHLTAVRPPVAARGHLEIDAVDRQPGHGWRLPAAMITALLDDPRAAEEAYAATVHLAGEPRLWERAARDALTDPVLADAARACFLAAYASFARNGAARELRDALADFTDAYVNRGRCPADDLLDHITGRV
ncbi:glutamylcysteine synthetase [Actinoplanes sp. SE50]|uniref:glutamate-cysteine ligase family protein n=1 Tax=unclassified Actinoplanes TaxID=2626549 RepID=UPI0009C266D8|nr:MULTISPECIES: glutamate-cysteine ligase family protein [unclassified Actinoplanes]ATO81592.1 glutamylcysteine synthetase [Actinoplanes sp. SE50]SLL99000.1 Glutamate--cysteine ligase GshA [Actinoplanes sp. SE50/110]